MSIKAKPHIIVEVRKHFGDMTKAETKHIYIEELRAQSDKLSRDYMIRCLGEDILDMIEEVSGELVND